MAITVEEIRKCKEMSKMSKDFEDGLCPICKGNLEPHLPCCETMCIGNRYDYCEECEFTTWELRRGARDSEELTKDLNSIFNEQAPAQADAKPLTKSQKYGGDACMDEGDADDN